MLFARLTTCTTPVVSSFSLSLIFPFVLSSAVSRMDLSFQSFELEFLPARSCIELLNAVSILFIDGCTETFFS